MSDKDNLPIKKEHSPLIKVGKQIAVTNKLLSSTSGLKEKKHQNLIKEKEKLNILVVDDKLSPRESIRKVLEEEGYNVTTVESGKDAIDTFRKEPFNLVITGIVMPGMDGITLLKGLKKISPLTPVIILTAHATIETAKSAIRLNAFDYLTKPFDKDELKAVVRKALKAEQKYIFDEIIEVGKSRGVLTYDEINEALPSEFFPPDDVEYFMDLLHDMGVRIVDFEAYTNGNKILVVDDELSPRESIRKILEEEGYNVTTAESGEEAIEIFHKNCFDLVTTCIMMPGMDGVTLLRELKKISPLTPVIILTAYATIETAKLAIKYGAFDLLIKPLDKDELKAVVRKGLKT